jgi:hypothetical protein
MAEESKLAEKPEQTGLAALFQAFYSELVLRDILGKAAPGAVLLLTIAASLTSAQVVVSTAWSATLGIWLVGTSVAWLTGLAIQGLGRFWWVSYIPRRADLESWRKLLIDFEKVSTTTNERVLERSAVLTEASGTGSVSLVLSIVVLLVAKLVGLGTSQQPSWATLGVIALVGAALVAGLINMHLEVRAWRYSYVKLVVEGSTKP